MYVCFLMARQISNNNKNNNNYNNKKQQQQKKSETEKKIQGQTIDIQCIVCEFFFKQKNGYLSHTILPSLVIIRLRLKLFLFNFVNMPFFKFFFF